jgi:hypothetical protein
MKEKINRHSVLVVGAEGRGPFGEDGAIILKWTLKEMEWEFVERIQLAEKQGQVVGCCELGNQPSDSIKC